jgi:hypothetical protein
MRPNQISSSLGAAVTVVRAVRIVFHSGGVGGLSDIELDLSRTIITSGITRSTEKLVPPQISSGTSVGTSGPVTSPPASPPVSPVAESSPGLPFRSPQPARAVATTAAIILVRIWLLPSYGCGRLPRPLHQDKCSAATLRFDQKSGMMGWSSTLGPSGLLPSPETTIRSSARPLRMR